MQLQLANIINNLASIYVALAVVLITILYYVLKNRGVPPGPIGIPVLGYWPFLKWDTCHLQLQNFGKKYGNVFSFKSIGRLFINLGSIKAIREAVVTKSEYFSERTKDNILHYYLDGGVVQLSGEPSKIIRKFFLQQFKERGMTVMKDALSHHIYDTVRETVKDLKETNGQSVDIASILLTKCNSIMRKTLFGEDGMSEQEMREFNEAYYNVLITFTNSNGLSCGIIARYFIIPFSKGIEEGKKGHELMKSILYKVLERRKSTYNENHIRDLIDAFYKERNDRKAKNDPTANYFTEEMLVTSLLQIVGDGVLFMALFICAFIKALLDHPEEQDTIYKELIDVVGHDRDPTIEDKNKLTYTNAFISEVMRTSDILTLFPTLECTKETTLAGYRIPKGSVLVYNFWMAHMNPEDFEQPEKFNPSRYIVKDRQERPELPVAFGMGKRSCLGEGFTMNQVFLHLTTIIKNFHLRRPAKESSNTRAFTIVSKTYVCAEPRN